MQDQEPVVLELAPLPREQIGPFLLLGLDKDADKAQVEKHWAKRVIWARKNQIRIALEDINWAREVVNDPERRFKADASSLTADTADGTLRRLAIRYGLVADGPGWEPLDREKDLRDYTPAIDMPDAAAVRAAVVPPQVPAEAPAVRRLLDAALSEPIDPWNLSLTRQPQPEAAS
jgi:hypothetical protein